MKITAHLNYLHVAPRKVRLVADTIRGKRVPEAERTLALVERRAAQPLAKLLASAVANARANFQITEPESLVVSEIRVGGGPTLKRIRARARGRAAPIRRRTSHVSLILEAAVTRPRSRRKAEIEVVRESQPLAGEAGKAEAEAARREREVFRAKAGRAQPVEFVKRMFRRKAI